MVEKHTKEIELSKETIDRVYDCYVLVDNTLKQNVLPDLRDEDWEFISVSTYHRGWPGWYRYYFSVRPPFLRFPLPPISIWRWQGLHFSRFMPGTGGGKPASPSGFSI